MIELKPCPFCGGKPIATETHPGRGFICCSECGATVHEYDSETPDVLTAAWNTRHVETCRWDYPQGVNGWLGYTVCSSCGERFDECVTDIARYCPSCGKKVEG